MAQVEENPHTIARHAARTALIQTI